MQTPFSMPHSPSVCPHVLHACTIKLWKQPYGSKLCSEVLEKTGGCTSSCRCRIPCVTCIATFSGLPLGQPCSPIIKVSLSYRISMMQLSLSKVSLKKKQRMQLLVVCGDTQCCTVAKGAQTWTQSSRHGLLNCCVEGSLPWTSWFSLLSGRTAGSHSVCCLPGHVGAVSELFQTVSPRLHSCAGLFRPSSRTLDLLLMNFWSSCQSVSPACPSHSE